MTVTPNDRDMRAKTLSINNTTSVMNWTDAGADFREGRNTPPSASQVEIFERDERVLAPHARIGIALALSLALWAGVAYVCMKVAF